MSDLISRKAVMNFIDSRIAERKPDGNSIWLRNDEAIDIQAGIEDLPTAYDVDKVVETLMENTCVNEERCYFIPEEAIRIVKGGGVDEI